MNTIGKNSDSALRIEVRDNASAILWMDVPGEPVNTLRGSFAEDFSNALDALERDSNVRAVVFASGKPDSFIAGADISMLKSVHTAAEAEALSRKAQTIMNRIARFPKPIVAAIHGACLGGGLEVALACHERVASDDRKTKLGLPEVQLGVIPGGGGTQRLAPLVGVQHALDLLLTGKQLNAAKAKKINLVDEVVPQAILVETANQRAVRLIEHKNHSKKPWDKDALEEFALAGNPLGRTFVFHTARKKTLAKTHGNYPAPLRIIKAVEEGLAHGFERGSDEEARAFGDLVVSAEARELMEIFFAQTALKKDSGVDDPSIMAKPVSKIGVLGAGLMGAGVAYVTSAFARLPVRLKDRDDQAALHGLSYVRGLVDEGVKKRRISRVEGDLQMAQVTAATTYSGFSAIDVVIEAVFEDLELKRRVLREVEDASHANTIFASNTSSLPISKIAEASRHPETVIGMHYFSPVHKMPLLEVIVTDKTAPWVTATCVALGKRQGKTVIVVRDGTGFYTTRILAPFLNEAFYILAEGVAIEDIDDALVKFGFPVGPMKLADEVGIDVGQKVVKIMSEAFGERMVAAPGLDKLIADKRLGRKNKRGFYLYEGKDKGVDETVYDVLGIRPTRQKMDAETIAWRCVLQMVNEAVLCFDENILRSARDGDIGAVFGLGFPPFRGGPFRLIDALSAQQILKKLEDHRNRYGMRFEPARGIVEHAQRSLRFHPVKPGSSSSIKPATSSSAHA